MKVFARDVWALVKPYWKSEERWIAWLLLGVIIALNLGDVYLSVLFNDWSKDWGDALQTVNKPAFIAALIRFSYLVFFAILVAVYKTYLNQMLRIKWRRWMTHHYLSRWLGGQNYYRMGLFGNPADNPDQRISDDIGQFLQLTLELSLGLLSAVVTLFTFLTRLWIFSGPLNFTIAGIAIHIPGYMVWVALLYSIFGTWITMKIGRPLVALNFNQQRYEADFRYSLIRLRENSESIAFYKGEAKEQEIFATRFSAVVTNFWGIMKRQKRLGWFTIGFGQIANVFPYIVAAPRFFTHEIQLGDLTQTAGAFGQVQGALSYIVDSYTTLASWQAVTERLCGFTQSIDQATRSSRPAANFERSVNETNSIQAKDLVIKLPDGKTLLTHIDLDIAAGDSLLITGASGSGKSTLLRVLAGLWPFAEGHLSLPAQRHLLFLPQKPYLPLGTLRQAFYYPHESEAASNDMLLEILSICQLSHLAPKLDTADNWSQILSLGEQQRIAFARIFLSKPDFIFLDEATSALDETAEAHLYSLLKSRLQGITIVSVGHRHTLRQFHNKEKSL